MTGPYLVIPGLTGLTVLAHGGYATIYRAVQESVGRDVAVKVENRTLENERDRRRFLREARAAGRMSSHPYVVDLIDVGLSPDGHPYLIMELCKGSYADRVREQPLRPEHVREVGVKIADALADAHALGVVHRDVKPANVLITGFDEPVLADFGLAILNETRDISITLDVLTPAYAPPEVFRQDPPAPSADVYGLCATLYALMHGRPPRWREGSSPSLVSLIDMFAEPLPDLPGVPEDLMRLLRAGMDNDPAARPTAGALRDALLALRLDPDEDRASPPAESTVPSWAYAGRPAGASPSHSADVPDDDVTVARPPGGGDTVPAKRPARRGGRGRTSRPGRPFGSARRRTRLGIAGSVAALVILVMSAMTGYGPIAGLLHAAHRPGTGPPTRPTSAAPGPSSSSVSGSEEPCSGIRALGARCPNRPECYGQLKVKGSLAVARQLACDNRHTWETFALAELPPDVTTADYRIVAAHPRVLQICNAGTLAMVTDFPVAGWRTEVLPPTSDAFRSGDRTYRCLASKGDDALVQQKLGKLDH